MHLNTKCAMAVSTAIAIVTAIPITLPLHTLPPTLHLWVVGLLSLVGMSLNGYQLLVERRDEHISPFPS